MGLATEAFKLKFPRSLDAMKKHAALIDKHVESEHARQILKSNMNLLALIVAEEVSEVGKQVGTGIAIIRGLFGKKD